VQRAGQPAEPGPDDTVSLGPRTVRARPAAPAWLVAADRAARAVGDAGLPEEMGLAGGSAGPGGRGGRCGGVSTLAAAIASRRRFGTVARRANTS
jgi:hypothetical protein